MTLQSTIEFVPMFEGEQTLAELLKSIIVDRILREMYQSALPKEQGIGYNVTKVPKDSEAPGLCEGVS